MSKIADLDVPVLVDEDVEWLEVAMNDSLGVDVQDALHDFEGQVLDVVGVHLLSVVPDDVHQVLSAVL